MKPAWTYVPPDGIIRIYPDSTLAIPADADGNLYWIEATTTPSSQQFLVSMTEGGLPRFRRALVPPPNDGTLYRGRFYVSVGPDHVYVIGQAGVLEAYDRGSGIRVWSRSICETLDQLKASDFCNLDFLRISVPVVSADGDVTVLATSSRDALTHSTQPDEAALLRFAHASGHIEWARWYFSDLDGLVGAGDSVFFIGGHAKEGQYQTLIAVNSSGTEKWSSLGNSGLLLGATSDAVYVKNAGSTTSTRAVDVKSGKTLYELPFTPRRFRAAGNLGLLSVEESTTSPPSGSLVWFGLADGSVSHNHEKVWGEFAFAAAVGADLRSDGRAIILVETKASPSGGYDRVLVDLDSTGQRNWTCRMPQGEALRYGYLLREMWLGVYLHFDAAGNAKPFILAVDIPGTPTGDWASELGNRHRTNRAP